MKTKIISFIKYWGKPIISYLKQKHVKVADNSGTYPKPQLNSYGSGNSVQIGHQTHTIDSRILFYGDNCKLIIGKNCSIRNTVFWFEGENGKIVINDSTTIEGACISVASANSITIGFDCMLSKDINICTTDSHSIIDEKRIRINPDKDINIGDHVWIGMRVLVCKGVTIGNNSVIGAGAIVTKNIPDNSCAAGIPAKIIKSDIDWLRKRI